MIPIGSQWLHRYALLIAAAALVSIVTGAAFTTNEERPLYSLGQSHLMVGMAAGILTVGLVIWLLQTERRLWMRRLAWIALAIVIVETLLGFITVPQPPAVRFAHAFLAQLFFAGSVLIAASTLHAWTQCPVVMGGRQSLRTLAMITAILVFGQAALGVAFRHGIIDVIPHVLGALIVAIIVAALAMSVLYRPENEQLRPAAVTLLIITAAQFFIGLTLFSMGLEADIDPEAVIVVTMVHAAVGALTLAATVVAVVLILRRVPAIVNRPGGYGRQII
jgi:heme A synthase